MGGKKSNQSSAGAGNGAATASSFNPETFGKQMGADVENAYKAGPRVYENPLYAGLSAQTSAGIDSVAGTASKAVGMFNGATGFAQGLISGADDPSLTERNLGAVAGGDYLKGGNPFFEANLAKAKDSTYADVMASLGGSGRTGSTIHMDELTGALGDLDNSARGQQYETERDRQVQALAAIEGQRQQGVSNAMAGASSLPGIYQASLLPGQTMIQAGQMRDADAQAKLMADFDLFERRDPYQQLAKYTNLLTSMQGNQGVAAKPKETPLWQTLLGGAIGLGAAVL